MRDDFSYFPPIELPLIIEETSVEYTKPRDHASIGSAAVRGLRSM